MVSILSRLVVAGMLVFNSASVVLGQDHTMALKLEWSTVSKGRIDDVHSCGQSGLRGKNTREFPLCSKKYPWRVFVFGVRIVPVTARS
jgi:hypothetical protein